MFSKFSEEAQKILLNAKKEMINLKHPYVGSEHLLLAILADEDSETSNKLKEYGITYKEFKNEVLKVIGRGNITNSWFLYTPLLKRIIENATIDAKESKDKEVNTLHLFLSLLEEGDGVAIRILVGMNVDIDLLYEEFSNNFILKKSKSKKRLLIEEFSVDLNNQCLNGLIDPVIGRDCEIERLIEILSRRIKNNPLLIGDAGVGKTAIVEALANRIILGMVPDSLKEKRILSVAMSSLVAGTKYRGEFEERINKIIREVENNSDIILFIDEIHTIIGAGGAEGAIDASNILKPALARGKIKIIGATTSDEYSKVLERDKALDRRFQKISVEEPNIDSTVNILLKIRNIYESYHNTKISDEVITTIVKLSDKYIYEKKFPDKAIDILDEVCVKTSLIEDNNDKKILSLNKEISKLNKEKQEQIINENFDKAKEIKEKQKIVESKLNSLLLKNKKNINKKDVSISTVLKVISDKTNIPISNFNLNNKNIVDLEKYLNNKIIGQSDAINKIVNYTKRRQLGFIDEKVYSFLLIGSTGIGKTKIVKEYANKLYSKDSFIRIDMSEYKEAHSISKIIGSPPGYAGYDDNNSILDKVRKRPYSVILLDEIEKAHIDVVRLFLQILDEGKIKDSKGNIVNFNSTVIFMTSNISSEKNIIGFKNNNNKLINELNDFFGVEFINRIDEIIECRKLDENDIKSIIREKLKMLKKYYLKRNINLSFSKKLIDEIIEESQYKMFGARRIEKVIDKKLNSYIINSVLEGHKKVTVKELL